MSDYSTMDDRALGVHVAESVLGMDWPLSPEQYVSWWGAGLVIDRLRTEGLCWSIEDYVGFTVVEVSKPYSEEYEGAANSTNPVRAVLIAALRAREAE